MHKIALIATILTIGIASAIASTNVHAQRYNVVGLIWEDTNCNGLQDAGEDGLAGVRVALIQQGTDTQVYTGDDRLLEYATGNGGGERLKGDIRFTRGLPGLPEDYYLAIFNADKPAGYVLAPVQAGTDRSIDNDLTKPLADSPLWATVPFQLILDGQVTNIDIGLCREGTQQPITYDNHLFLPLIIT